MNSYSVKATGENKRDPGARLIHVDITINGSDDQDANDKAVAYLRRVYPACDWRVDAVNQLAEKRPPTRRKPKPIQPRRPPRRPHA